MSAARYAVYAAPEPDHPLWQAGCAWLGRDPTRPDPGLPPPYRRAPWRYGFHATLKAPMHLARGRSEQGLVDALHALAATHRGFTLPPLGVAALGRFVALRPLRPCAPLQRLADDCVTRLDGWRRPLDAEAAARRATGLDDEQRALLARWGYPHVLQRWRCHFTLSDDLDDELLRGRVQAEAAAWFREALQVPLALRSLCLFVEPQPGAPLQLRLRVPLAAGDQVAARAG